MHIVKWLSYCLILLASSPIAGGGQEEPLSITFLNVGQGDAIVIRTPTGHAALIDAGPGVDITSALARLGIDTLDLVVASHPHADHIGGMWQVLRSVPVRLYLDNGQPHTTTTYLTVMRELLAHPEIGYLRADPRTLTLGDTKIHVLRLPPYPSSDFNNSSVGLVVEHGAFLAFLSGDSEVPELEHFLEAGVVPDVTLFKAPHHGSDNGVSQAFLDVARPEVIVVSVGGNSYGHPAPHALSAYQAVAAHVLRTDLDGDVTVLGFTDGRYEVSAGGGAAGAGMRRSSAVALSVFADAPGNDHENLNGEYLVLSNPSPEPLSIARWTLCDLARHCFTFPAGASIAGEGQVIVFTGFGVADGTRFYMGSGSAVWNNDGDTATLYDENGEVVTIYVY